MLPLTHIRNAVWYDFVNAKNGDEYLVLYISRQRTIRKCFKIFTVLLSASGIWSSLASLKIPTVIICSAIALVQGATSIENWIIHSEDDLDKVGRLRMYYYERCNELEKLWFGLIYDDVPEEKLNTISADLFKIREKFKVAEELDNKLHIWQFKGLKKKASKKALLYFNTYLL